MLGEIVAVSGPGTGPDVGEAVDRNRVGRRIEVDDEVAGGRAGAGALGELDAERGHGAAVLGGEPLGIAADDLVDIEQEIEQTHVPRTADGGDLPSIGRDRLLRQAQLAQHQFARPPDIDQRLQQRFVVSPQQALAVEAGRIDQVETDHFRAGAGNGGNDVRQMGRPGDLRRVRERRGLVGLLVDDDGRDGGFAGREKGTVEVMAQRQKEIDAQSPEEVGRRRRHARPQREAKPQGDQPPAPPVGARRSTPFSG